MLYLNDLRFNLVVKKYPNVLNVCRINLVYIHLILLTALSFANKKMEAQRD